MNTNTGDLYRLDANAQPVTLNGVMPEGPAELRALRDRFADELRRGDVVPVSEQVAQTVLLGKRERERRTRRRQAAKAARKRNR